MKPPIAAGCWASGLTALPQGGGSDKRFVLGRVFRHVFLGFEFFYFFLEAELAAFEFGDFQAIDEGAGHFHFDLAMDGSDASRSVPRYAQKGSFPGLLYMLTLYGTAIICQKDDAIAVKLWQVA